MQKQPLELRAEGQSNAPRSFKVNPWERFVEGCQDDRLFSSARTAEPNLSRAGFADGGELTSNNARATTFYDFLLQNLLDQPLDFRHEGFWVEEGNFASAVSQLQGYFVPP